VSTLSATFSFKEPRRLDSVPQNQTASPETICENVDLVDLWQLSLLVHPAAPKR
jgi:hypothetical protein